MKQIIIFSILIFLIGCASQQKPTVNEVDKYIHLAEQNYKKGDFELASKNLRIALDFNPNDEQTKEINVLFGKIIEGKSELETKEEKKESEVKKKSVTITVYITKSGKKYHQSWCSYLRKSSIPISLKDAKARGYTPCSKCNPPR